jgi:hypothetical protein
LCSEVASENSAEKEADVGSMPEEKKYAIQLPISKSLCEK